MLFQELAEFKEEALPRYIFYHNGRRNMVNLLHFHITAVDASLLTDPFLGCEWCGWTRNRGTIEETE